MNTKKWLIFLLLINYILLLACSKDKGNYSYVDINKISIDSGVIQSTSYTDRVYNILLGDTLVVRPSISGTISKQDTSNLQFSWVVNKDTISHSKNLTYFAKNGYGKFIGNYYITDKSTGLVLDYNFTISVNFEGSRGYYFLEEDANQNAIFASKATNTNNSQFRFTNIIDGYTLGKNVSGFTMTQVFGQSSSNYTYYIQLATKQGNNNLLIASMANFTTTFVYTQNSYLQPNEVFSPTQLVKDPASAASSYGVFFLNNGKVHSADNGVAGLMLYPNEPLNYNFKENGFFDPYILTAYYIAGYDYNNSEVRVFKNNLFGTPYTYDMNFDAMTSKLNLTGHTFIKGVEEYYQSYYGYSFLTSKQDTLYLSRLRMQDYTVGIDSAYIVGKSYVPNVSKMVVKPVYNRGNNFWYIAIGRSIYRTSSAGVEMQKVLDLPADNSGDITVFNFEYDNTSAFDKIGIATYNANSSEEHKGSFYIFDISENKIIETYTNSLDNVKYLQMGY